jgi:hypothetical protein
MKVGGSCPTAGFGKIVSEPSCSAVSVSIALHTNTHCKIMIRRIPVHKKCSSYNGHSNVKPKPCDDNRTLAEVESILTVYNCVTLNLSTHTVDCRWV